LVDGNASSWGMGWAREAIASLSGNWIENFRLNGRARAGSRENERGPAANSS
jgi:hypothetical protein